MKITSSNKTTGNKKTTFPPILEVTQSSSKIIMLYCLDQWLRERHAIPFINLDFLFLKEGEGVGGLVKPTESASGSRARARGGTMKMYLYARATITLARTHARDYRSRSYWNNILEGFASSQTF